MKLFQANDRHLVHAFFADRLGLHWSDDFRGVVHVPEGCRDKLAEMDDVAVAVGYNAFIGRTCCMHVVIQKPEAVSPRMVRESFEYPFLVCGCTAILAPVDSTNAAALKFDRKLGFSDFAVIPNGGTEGDLIWLRMLRSECRWLRQH